MRIFLAGASGAIGRPLVPALVTAGHRVTGMTRRERAAERIREDGAEAVICDVFDPEALEVAVGAARPDVVVHQVTSFPTVLEPRKKGLFDTHNRVRREGTRNLIAAARAAGATRFVAQSIAFVYAPVGGPVKTEDDPVAEGAGGEFGATLDAALELERQVLGADGLEGLALRFGAFYGPGTSYAADGHQASEVRRRRFPIVGDGAGITSFIHVADGAAATVAACERGAPGIYNVCDSDPAALREWLPVYAEALGAKRPLRVPKLVVRAVAGEPAVILTTTMRGASNRKAIGALGWEPRYPSWRQGFFEALG
ncbi:MAG TPA: NAD(P)-dependent oxidoreductase [Solirubrobacterales bacterium]|nr:NAD(P)-dependent oxidoreductase [Solirubrobacterales bacterium]